MPISNLENVARVFNEYDKEKVGTIEVNQLDPAYQTLGIHLNKAELNNIVSQINLDW